MDPAEDVDALEQRSKDLCNALRWRDAENILRQLLDRLREATPPDENRIMKTLHNLAFTLWKQTKLVSVLAASDVTLDSADAVLRDLLQMQINFLGHDHVDVLQTERNLDVVQEEALEGRQQVRGTPRARFSEHACHEQHAAHPAHDVGMQAREEASEANRPRAVPAQQARRPIDVDPPVGPVPKPPHPEVRSDRFLSPSSVSANNRALVCPRASFRCTGREIPVTTRAICRT